MLNNVQGIILAGDKGKRLYPLTRKTPKPLLALCGQPLVQYSINAFQNADINDITIVACDTDAFAPIGKFGFIHTSGIESILYVFTQCIPFLNHEYALFADGDSVYAKDVFSDILSRTELGFDLLIAVSTNSPSASMWTYKTHSNLIIDIIQKESLMPRFGVFVKTSAANSFFELLLSHYNLQYYKYENRFLPGYEQYYVGWGLIIKLYIENGFTVALTVSDNFFCNINTQLDIKTIERYI